jgi:predicted RNA-binding protein with PIN domain
MKIILIDGYNVIHHSPSLKALLSRSVSRAQSELIKMVVSYCSLVEMKGYVVFDAYRRPVG